MRDYDKYYITRLPHSFTFQKEESSWNIVRVLEPMLGKRALLCSTNTSSEKFATQEDIVRHCTDLENVKLKDTNMLLRTIADKLEDLAWCNSVWVSKWKVTLPRAKKSYCAYLCVPSNDLYTDTKCVILTEL